MSDTISSSGQVVKKCRPLDGFTLESTAAPMARFLAAALSGAGPGSKRLYCEIERINPSKNLGVSELITASARLRHGALQRNRYDAAVSWLPDDHERFFESAVNGASTPRLRELLASPASEIAEWLGQPGKAITYLGGDFDERRYKLYFLRDHHEALSDSIALESLAPRLHALAYIDCLELDMETAAPTRSAYWKLGAVSFSDTLEPRYRPHPRIENRILRIDGRTRVVSALEAIVRGPRQNDPIIKFRRPRGVWAPPDVAELAASAYAVECSLFNFGQLKYVNDYTEEILAISSVYSCRDQVARWLEDISPFDCYIHYVGIGADFVTFYCQRSPLANRGR